MRSKFGTKIFDFADLMPFGETAVTLEKWHPSDNDFINANYMKSVYQEDHPRDNSLPFGLMIATSGPKSSTI